MITQEDGLLALRNAGVAPLAVAAGTDSSGKAASKVTKGAARLLGRVVSPPGRAGGERSRDAGRRGGRDTRANGEFVLDSLPAGTQAVTVRHLGYAPTEVAVELSARAPARVSVQMGPYVPELAPMEVVSRMEQGLDRVGWTSRKRGASEVTSSARSRSRRARRSSSPTC